MFFAPHPLLVVALVVALAWATSPLWLGVWTPWRSLQRRQEITKLRRTLHHNPADRDARFRLAGELVARGEHAEASDLLGRNVAAGDDDPTTLALAGVAAFGSRKQDACERGQELLERARAGATKIQLVEIDLALARGWMANARWTEARDALRRYCDARPGSIEAMARLARVHQRLGDREDAARARADAWARWRAKPRFQRKLERRWAWRVRPAAGAAHLGITVAPIAAAAWLVSNTSLPSLHDVEEQDEARPRLVGEAAIVREYAELELDRWPARDWDIPRTTPTPTPSRFEVRAERRTIESPTRIIFRGDLNNDGFLDQRRKAVAADFVCRVPESFGPPLAGQDGWVVRDTETDAEIFALFDALEVFYIVHAADEPTARRSALAFEEMIEDQPLRDCVVSLDGWPGGDIGVEAGAPFADGSTASDREVIDDE